MPNYQGVWDITTQFQYAAEWPEPIAGRAIFVLDSGSSANNYNYVDIVSTGNASVFGNLNQATYFSGGFSSSTRAIRFGGFAGSSTYNYMEYITIASTGNGTDFGDLTNTTKYATGVSNGTRGVRIGGITGGGGFFGSVTGTFQNTMDYVTIASTGNATDFGDLTEAKGAMGAAESTTRGVIFGGNTGTSYSSSNVIEYITIGSTGNGTDFGDLTQAMSFGGALSSSTRGVSYFTSTASAVADNIEYVTIASTGNSTDFGDLSVKTRGYLQQGTSNKVKGLMQGNGDTTIQQLTIASTGNTTDYGDLTGAAYGGSSMSDSHGGIA